MRQYKTNQVLEVTIEHILPFGVFARLADGSLAYIRRRELALDADIEPKEAVYSGQVIKAIVIETDSDENHLELSHRATLGNPWKLFSENHKVGDVIRGRVMSILPSGIFLRVAPGVNGFVPASELSTWESVPDDIFWVGDETEAVISILDFRNKSLVLSIRARIMQHNQAMEIFEIIAAKAELEMPAPQFETHELAFRHNLTLNTKRIGKILIVEDDNEMRSSFAKWLTYRGLIVDQAGSLAKALQLSQKNEYNIIFLDLNLDMEDGMVLACELQKQARPTQICIISSPFTIFDHMADIKMLSIAQIFPKPLDMADIEDFLVLQSQGKFVSSVEWKNEMSSASPTSFLPGSSAQVDSRESLTTRLQKVLHQISKALQAQHSFIFELNPGSNTITILSQAGHLDLNEAVIYHLVNSPVQDVILRGEAIFENHVKKKARAKFENLLKLIDFGACIGIPLQVQDNTHHAVFFFHKDANAFRYANFQDAKISAMLIAVILEKENLERRLQLLNPLLLSGEMTAGLGHEVFNKVSSLELQVSNLLPLQSQPNETEDALNHLLKVILDLKETAQSFQQLMAAPDMSGCYDVNLAIQRAVTLLKPVAQKESTRINLSFEQNLPVMQGSSLAVQQAFLNIILNAIQQMTIKTKKFKWTGPHNIRIITKLDKTSMKVRIQVADTGPGIHTRLLERIFTSGFSTRGGSGLGLYIALSFIKPLGGTIRVEESLIPLGTTFLVELPVNPPEGETK